MSRVQKEFYVNDQKDAASIKHIDESSQKSGQLEDVEPEGGRRSLPGLQTSTESTPFKVHFKTWIIVFASSLAFCAYVWALVAFGLNQRAVAAGVGDPENFIWIQNAAQLVSLVVAPPLGKISDAVGRKAIIIFGLTLGALGLVLTGAATTIGMAIAGSAIFGFSSASAYILSAVVSEILPRRQRGLVQALFNLGATVGNLIGSIGGQAISGYPLIGGRPGYAFAFYVPGILMFLSGVMIAVCYNPPPTPNPDNLSYTTRFLDFDVPGTLLLIAGIAPLTIGLTWGGSIYPWSSYKSYVPVLVGGIFLVILALHQIFVTKTGLLHHQMFQGRNMAIACGLVFVEGMFYFTYNAFFGEETNILFEARPVIFGLRFGVFAMGNLIGYPLVGWYNLKYRRVKEPLVLGFLVFSAIMAAQSQAAPVMSWDHAFIAFSALAGIVFTAPELLVFVIAQLDVPPALVGTASTLLGSIRALGGVIGTAVATSIFSVKIAAAIPVFLPPVLVEAGLPPASIPAFIGAVVSGSPAAFTKVPGVTPAIVAAGVQAYKQAFAHSFSYVWYFVLPFVVAGLFLSLCLASVKDQMTWVINRPVEAIHAKHHHGDELS